MIQDYLHKSVWFIGLLLLQVLVLNNVHILGGYATPFLYIYLILKMDSDTPRNALMAWAFVQGLAVDLFSDTPGMNAASATLLAFMRPGILRLFASRDVTGPYVPATGVMGMVSYVKYAAAGVLLHHAVLLTLEYFSAASIPGLLLRIPASTVLSLACILALDAIRRK